jgi:hypothetical protein
VFSAPYLPDKGKNRANSRARGFKSQFRIARNLLAATVTLTITDCRSVESNLFLGGQRKVYSARCEAGVVMTSPMIRVLRLPRTAQAGHAILALMRSGFSTRNRSRRGIACRTAERRQVNARDSGKSPADTATEWRQETRR